MQAGKQHPSPDTLVVVVLVAASYAQRMITQRQGAMMPGLFDPLAMGELRLANRFVMAPLTRCRAVGGGRVPNALMAKYYVQRASAGLIISEGVPISPMAVGHANVPGLWTDEQVAGWRLVTDALHAAGGCIVAQLWHVGRVSDPELLGGALPVGPSPIAPKGHVNHLRPLRPFVTPRPLESAEIPAIVGAYRRAAENAVKAGFDGVELHGANGYLLDQFLQDGSNQRTDAYGGPIENRARLMLEATDACIGVWGAGRVGMHLSPRSENNSMGDSDPASTFAYAASELGRRGIAFLFVRERVEAPRQLPRLKAIFGGKVIANERFTQAQAEQVLAAREADAVAWGTLYISNPDLPNRFAKGAALNAPDPETFFYGGEHGYTDYPTLEQAMA
jgi:2,4-dienoyl-CoA reductase-like NADH-dependent reductase (Old Yellow Enzyme family)